MLQKTEVILFKPKNKQLDTDLKLKLCRKRLYTLPMLDIWVFLLMINLNGTLILIIFFQNL